MLLNIYNYSYANNITVNNWFSSQIIFNKTFNTNWQKEWNINSTRKWWFENIKVINNNTLKVFYPKWTYKPSVKPRWWAGFIKKFNKWYKELELSYNIKFDKNFDFVKWWKLPWLCWWTCPTWWESRDNWFSTRFMWRRNWDLEIYAYLPNWDKYWTSLWRWNFRFEKNKFYNIKQEITLNDLWKSNWIIKYFVDNKLYFQKNWLIIIKKSNLKIDWILFSTFFWWWDKSWASTVNTYTYFNDFKVTTTNNNITNTINKNLILISPYVDSTLYPITKLSEIYKKTNLKNYTLWFITSNKWKCEANWGWYYNIDKWPSSWSNWKEEFLYNEIKYIKNKWWNLTISFWWQAWKPLFSVCNNVDSLTKEYIKVIEKLQIYNIDFDIEWNSINDSKKIDNLIYAIKNIKNKYPKLKLRFTLPVMPKWLSDTVLKNIIDKLKQNWLNNVVINIMTMDYGNQYNKDMADYAIQAVENTNKQLKNIFWNNSNYYNKIWITPMIWLNDIKNEIFTLNDAIKIKNFSKNKNIALLSYWSINRDHKCDKNTTDNKCSSKNVQNNDYDFLKNFSINNNSTNYTPKITNNTTQFSFTWTLTSIIDWDTIKVYTWTNINNPFKIRLLWFDTPEKYLFNIKDYKYYWCWITASNFAEKKLKIWKIYNFFSDNLAKKEDKYWRKLRFLQLSTWSLTSSWTYWYQILKQWLANYYKYENHSFTWIYQKIDNENKLLQKWMYNSFCKAQNNYIKTNWKRKWWEINKIIEQVLKSKHNFHYQLQKANFDKLKTLKDTIIFLEIDDINLTPEQVNELKNNWNILIWYVSIWEAETWRDYWNKNWINSNWNLTSKAPSWLWKKNPNWNSYKVKFWENWWKNIVFKRIDKIKNAWYDGILMDVVDVYDYWQNQVPNDKKVTDADDKMVQFIKEIREHLWNYLAIIPNQWFELVEKPWYLNLINWFLTESVFSSNNKERKEEDKNWQTQYLDQVTWAWKIVMDIDYIPSSKNDLVCKYYDYVKNKWYLWADYKLALDSFDKITCKNTNLKPDIPSCKKENWTCTSSCWWTWQKIWTCQWWLVENWSCGWSCGWGGWWWSHIYKRVIQLKKKNKSNNNSIKHKILFSKILLNNLKYKLIGYFKTKWLLKDSIISIINNKINYFYWKEYNTTNKLLLKNDIYNILKYYWNIKTKNTNNIDINTKTIKLNKTKSIIENLNFYDIWKFNKLKTNKYYFLLKKYFYIKKKIILNKQNYQNLKTYNFLRFFISYSKTFLNDFDTNNIKHIKTYINEFKKVIIYLHKIK